MITYKFLYDLIDEEETKTLYINNLRLTVRMEYESVYECPLVINKSIVMKNINTNKYYYITKENWDEHFAMFSPFKEEILEFIQKNFAHKIILENL